MMVHIRISRTALLPPLAVLCVLASATEALAQSKPAPSADQLSWFLGRRWTEAALTHARAGAGQRDVPEKLFKASETLAGGLGVTFPPPFERVGDASKDTATALHYVLTSGKDIESSLQARKGTKAAGLFALAEQSVLAQVLYDPEGDLRTALATNIENAGQRSEAAKTAWQPVVVALRGKEPAEKVNEELSALMRTVEASLEGKKER
jgi:hypothetical protein